MRILKSRTAIHVGLTVSDVDAVLRELDLLRAANVLPEAGRLAEMRRALMVSTMMEEEKHPGVPASLYLARS